MDAVLQYLKDKFTNCFDLEVSLLVSEKDKVWKMETIILRTLLPNERFYEVTWKGEISNYKDQWGEIWESIWIHLRGEEILAPFRKFSPRIPIRNYMIQANAADQVFDLDYRQENRIMAAILAEEDHRFMEILPAIVNPAGIQRYAEVFLHPDLL